LPGSCSVIPDRSLTGSGIQGNVQKKNDLDCNKNKTSHTKSQRIEISRKEQKEQKINKCQPHQKFVMPAKAGIQGNALKPMNTFIARSR
jgi:hypothetical protein